MPRSMGVERHTTCVCACACVRVCMRFHMLSKSGFSFEAMCFCCCFFHFFLQTYAVNPFTSTFDGATIMATLPSVFWQTQRGSHAKSGADGGWARQDAILFRQGLLHFEYVHFAFSVSFCAPTLSRGGQSRYHHVFYLIS